MNHNNCGHGIHLGSADTFVLGKNLKLTVIDGWLNWCVADGTDAWQPLYNLKEAERGAIDAAELAKAAEAGAISAAELAETAMTIAVSMSETATTAANSARASASAAEASKEFAATAATAAARDAVTASAAAERATAAWTGVEDALEAAEGYATTARNAAAESGENAANARNARDAAVPAAERAVASANNAAESERMASAMAVTAINAKDTAVAANTSAQYAMTTAQSAASIATTAKTSAESSAKSATTSSSEARSAMSSASLSAANAAASAKRIEDKATQIDQNTTDIAQTRGELAALSNRVDNIDEVIIETVQPLQKQVDENERSLDALWKLNKGQTYDLEQREESGMNEAPSGVEFMSLEEVHGKTTQGAEPSSENPQEIHSVEQINVKHTGKNLVDSNVYTTNTPTIVVLDAGIYTVSQIGGLNNNNWYIGAQDLDGNTITESALTFASALQLNGSKTWYYGYSGSRSFWVKLNVKCQLRIGRLNANGTLPLQIEYGSVATDFVPYKPIVTRTITPPRPLNAIGENKDKADVDNGVWAYAIKEITAADYTHSIVLEPQYFALPAPTTEPIAADDLDFLRSLALLPATDHIIITDQDGNDVPWLSEYIINLREVTA